MDSRAELPRNLQELPRFIIWAVLAACVLPLFGSVFEPSFASLASSSVRIDPGADFSPGPVFHLLAEWTACCTALLAAGLALAHARVRADLTTLVVGIGLLFAGVLDGVHALVAANAIDLAGYAESGLPVSWATGRFVGVLIRAGGIGFLLLRNDTDLKGGLGFATLAGAMAVAVSYAAVRAGASASALSGDLVSSSSISRPYDMAPLVLFALAGIFIYRPFHRDQGSVISHAVLASAIPDAALEAYLVFGCREAYDPSFIAAHLLKVVAYGVVMAGLILEYIATHEAERRAVQSFEAEVRSRELTELAMARRAEELARSNSELQQFAYVASHDLQEPLRKIHAFGDRLLAKCGPELSPKGVDYVERMQAASTRMHELIRDLLAYSRVATRGEPLCEVDLEEVVRAVLLDLEYRIERTHGRVEVGPLPRIDADPRQMSQLFQNLIGNSLKFHREAVPPQVKISSSVAPVYGGAVTALVEVGRVCRISVEDNGIGFDSTHAEKIFTIFHRLHGRRDYDGTGVGLAIVRKIAERHGGKVRAVGRPGQGATFTVELPVTGSSDSAGTIPGPTDKPIPS